jgi:hypothetical protein
MKVHMRKQIGFAALGVAFLASGCSGGSSSAPVVPASGKANAAKTGPTTKAKLTIKIPIRKHVSSTKVLPKYVSAATTGLYIRAGVLGGITSATSWQSFDVTPASSTTASPVKSQQCGPDPTGQFTTCTVTVTAPAVPGATDEFQIIATDSAPSPTQPNLVPTGFFLSAFDDTGVGGAGEPIAVGSQNAINVSLEGIIGRLLGTDVSVWAAPGQPTTFSGYVTAFDADNNVIIGNPQAFSNPIVLNDNLASSPFTYLASSLTPATTGPVVAQMGYTAPTSSMAPTTVYVTVSPLPAWIAGPAADYNQQTLQPKATFQIDPMTVNVGSQSTPPVGTIQGLAVGAPDVEVIVNETEATSFTISDASDVTSFTLLDATDAAPLLPAAVPDKSGNLTFYVHAVSATSDSSSAISITDDRKTNATLPAFVAESPLPTQAIHRARR